MQKLNQEERDEALDNIARTVSELHSARIAGYGHFRDSSSIGGEPCCRSPATLRSDYWITRSSGSLQVGA